MRNLDKLFKPKTIAVVGASDRENSVGNALMENLINGDYDGIVYPVNNKRKNVHSIKTYKSVKKIPDKIDLAIIAVPARFVPEVMEECGQSGVGAAVIISAGFNEIGSRGEALGEKVINIGKKYNIRILGPNCLGFIRPSLNLNASFASKMALKGKIAFISQSGALCTSILDWAVKNNVGFSNFVSIGSMLDISFADLIDYFGQDKETESILIYMESLTRARKFLSAARAFSRSKPIIVLKAGSSSAGAKAALSHTGSLAGNDSVFNAAFERAGIIRVNTIVELFHVAKTLAMQKRPQNKNLAIITNAGGPGVLAIDALIKLRGKPAVLSRETISKLDKCLPPEWSRGNPVDILEDADPNSYSKAVKICLEDKNVGAVLVILTPQAMTDPIAVAKKIVGLAKRNKNKKTILASWMGGFDVGRGREILEKGNVPIYRSPEDAIRTFSYISSYTKNLELLYETPATIPHAFKPKTKKTKEIFNKIIYQNRTVLTEIETKEILRNYHIPTLKNAIARNIQEVIKASKIIPYPIAMKILSPDVIHKTDVGGVELNIKNRQEAESAYKKIIKSVRENFPKAKLDGVIIEPMAKKRYDLLIGCKKDPIFGPVIVFGMGGVAVEVFKDIKAGLPPLNMALAMRMIKETKIYKLLKGYRNMPGVDLQAIQFLLYKFSYLIVDFPQIKEIDINPFTVDESGGVVLDAKIILDEKIIKKRVKPYSHLVISPYPKEYISRFKMKNGKTVLLRPIKPEDEKMEKELFKTFSHQSLRFRFFKVLKNIDHNLLTRFTQIDYDREIAIVALLKEGGREKIIGVSRLMADPENKSAEFAVAIGDPWHFQGLGNKLTDYILEIARQRGIENVWAKFLKSNKSMLEIFRKRNFEISKKGQTMFAELNLRE